MVFKKKNKRVKNFDAVIKNPQKRKRKRVSFVQNFVFTKYSAAVLVFLLVIGVLFYYFFLSGEFEITDVNIAGLNEELTQEVSGYYSNTARENKFIFLSQNNSILFPRADFEEGVIAAIPKIKNVEANVAYPHKLSISAQERKQKGIWCNYASNPDAPFCYFYDFGGVVYEEAPGVARGSLIVAIRDSRTPDIRLPEKVLDRDVINYLDTLVEALEIGYRRPAYITIKEGDEVRIGFSGWEAYLSRSQNIVESVENMILVLDEKVGSRVNELEYIDLRLGNKVFFKYRDLEAEEDEIN